MARGKPVRSRGACWRPMKPASLSRRAPGAGVSPSTANGFGYRTRVCSRLMPTPHCRIRSARSARRDTRRIQSARHKGKTLSSVAAVGFRYALRWADGDNAGTAEYPDDGIQAGDEIRINGNQRVRVRAVIPVELAAEFVDDACTGHSRSNRCRASRSEADLVHVTIRLRGKVIRAAARSASTLSAAGFRRRCSS